MSDRKLRVFLCHASQDKPIVREIYQRLNAEDWIDPWLDEEKLLPGQDWKIEIEKAVEAADVVIVCLSNNSVSKEGYIQREIRFALDIALEKPEGTIFIIPLRLEVCQPPRSLKMWQYVNYFPTNRRNLAYDRMLKSLMSRTKAIYKPSLYKEKNPKSLISSSPRKLKNSWISKNVYLDTTDSYGSEGLSLSKLPEVRVSIKLGFIGFISASILELFTSIIFVNNFYLLINGLFFGLGSGLFSLRLERPVSRKQSIIVGVVSSTICGAIISIAYFITFKSLDAFIYILPSENELFNILSFLLSVVGGVVVGYLNPFGRHE